MTNISRKEREELNAMSLELFGVSSKWQKLLARQRIHYGWKVDERATEERQAQAKMLKASGVDSPEIEAALTSEVKTPLFRLHTLSEVKEAMRQALDANEYARLSPSEGAKKAAKQFIEKSLSVEISLLLSDEEKPIYENMLVDVPKELSDQFTKLVTNMVSKTAHNLSAVVFVETVLGLLNEA